MCPYDPYQVAQPSHAAVAQALAADVLRYQGKSTNLSAWAVDPNAPGPRQRNGWDCGVFVSCWLRCKAEGRDPNVFQEKDMKLIRDRFAYELLTGFDS